MAKTPEQIERQYQDTVADIKRYNIERARELEQLCPCCACLSVGIAACYW